MKRNAGFTLIELIIVIVILGILAITAAPKFMNMQSEARASTINGMKATVQSAANLVYSKAIIKGLDKKTTATDLSIDGTTTNNVSTIYGYPTANAAGIKVVVFDTNSTEWTGEEVSADGVYYIYPTTGGSKTCAVTYKAATSTTAGPTIDTVITGC